MILKAHNYKGYKAIQKPFSHKVIVFDSEGKIVFTQRFERPLGNKEFEDLIDDITRFRGGFCYAE